MRQVEASPRGSRDQVAENRDSAPRPNRKQGNVVGSQAKPVADL